MQTNNHSSKIEQQQGVSSSTNKQQLQTSQSKDEIDVRSGCSH